jgi:hypothetical protein
MNADATARPAAATKYRVLVLMTRIVFNAKARRDGS